MPMLDDLGPLPAVESPELCRICGMLGHRLSRSMHPACAVFAVDSLIILLGMFVDDDPCVFDHHGYCQTHGPGPRPCHVEIARRYLALAQSSTEQEASEIKAAISASFLAQKSNWTMDEAQ